MARAYAPLKSSIWTNRDFCSLSSAAQRVYLLAMSQPNISWAGVVPFTEKRWASFASDTTRGSIAEAVNELVDRGFVVLDDDTEELWIRSFVKHNRILEQPQLRKKAVGEAVAAVVSATIRAAVLSLMPDDVKAQVISRGGPLTEGVAEPLPAGDVSLDLDLDLNPNTNRERTPSPNRLAHHDLLRADAAPPLLDEADQIIAALLDVYGERVDGAVVSLLDERRRFVFPSDLRKALRAMLGPAPSTAAQPEWLRSEEETARADRVNQAAGNAATAALGALSSDPELNRAGIAAARGLLAKSRGL